MDIEKSNSKSIVGVNKRDWDKMRIRGMHADTNLIRCQKGLFPDAYGKKLLDLGFGEGQNLVYFLSQGFQACGTEIAESRLRFLKDTLIKHRLKADLRLVHSNILPFEDNYFDIVVAWESLYYNNEAGVRETLGEILRVLKPGGRFLSSMISTKHKLCGEKITRSVFRAAKSSQQKHCIIYPLKNKKHLMGMYRNFKRIQVGFYSSLLFAGTDFHYVIYCEK